MSDCEEEKGPFEVSINPLELKEEFAKKRTQADAIISGDDTSFGQHYLSVISNAYQFMHTMIDAGPCHPNTKKSLEQFRAIRETASSKDNGKGWSKKHRQHFYEFAEGVEKIVGYMVEQFEMKIKIQQKMLEKTRLEATEDTKIKLISKMISLRKAKRGSQIGAAKMPIPFNPDEVITIEDDEEMIQQIEDDSATSTSPEAEKPEDGDRVKVKSRDIDDTGKDAIRSSYFAAASPAPMNRPVDAARRTRSPGSRKPAEVKEKNDDKSSNVQAPQKRKTRASSISSGNDAKKEKKDKNMDKKMTKNTVRKTTTHGRGNEKPKSVVSTPAQDKNNNDRVKENHVKKEVEVKKVEMFKYNCGVCSFQTPNQVVFEEHGKTCK